MFGDNCCGCGGCPCDPVSDNKFEFHGFAQPKCSLEKDIAVFEQGQTPPGTYEVRYCKGAFFEFAGWTVSRIPKFHGPIYNPFTSQSDIYTYVFYLKPDPTGGTIGTQAITWFPEDRPEGWGAATQALAEKFANCMKVTVVHAGGPLWIQFNSQEPGDPNDTVDGNPNPTYGLYRIKHP